MNILTCKKAYELLEEAEKLNPGGWIEHSKRVGEAAKRIATKIGVDPEKAMTLGYIHDIGKRFGPKEHHVAKGYEFLKELGYEEYGVICLTHSYLNNDINCTAGGIPDPNGYKYEFRKNFIEKYNYTIYDQIINLCDLICTNEFVILEQRLIDIMLRRGAYENSVYHIREAIKLKEQIEGKMGCSIYSIFPEITENLNKSKSEE